MWGWVHVCRIETIIDVATKSHQEFRANAEKKLWRVCGEHVRIWGNPAEPLLCTVDVIKYYSYYHIIISCCIISLGDSDGRSPGLRRVAILGLRKFILDSYGLVLDSLREPCRTAGGVRIHPARLPYFI